VQEPVGCAAVSQEQLVANRKELEKLTLVLPARLTQAVLSRPDFSEVGACAQSDEDETLFLSCQVAISWLVELQFSFPVHISLTLIVQQVDFCVLVLLLLYRSKTK
jgi:hypothetical protein